jgi:hypothetical protein
VLAQFKLNPELLLPHDYSQEGLLLLASSLQVRPCEMGILMHLRLLLIPWWLTL